MAVFLKIERVCRSCISMAILLYRFGISIDVQKISVFKIIPNIIFQFFKPT